MNAPAELRDVGALDRTSYIGGADISAIVGVNPYQTPLDVYLQKIGEAPPERPDPKADARKRRGKLWEPIVVEMLREEHGIEIVARNARYIDREFPFMAAEIDFEWTRISPPLLPGEMCEREVSAVMNGEIKSVHPLAAGRWGEAETGEVPMEHAAQSQWGLMISGRDLCQYGVVFGADDLTLYHVRRDDDVIDWMREEARRFWTEHVVPRIPPPPRTIDDCKRLWPKDSGRSLAATPELAGMFATWQALCERRRVAQEGIDAVEFEIAERMQDHTSATFGDEPLFTYKQQSSTHVAAAELKAALPDVYKRFARTSEFRVLRKATKRG